MSNKIFISYRRDDSKQFTQLLSNELSKYYNPDSFFRDVESIHGGANFKRSIAQALYLTKICLVVIGDKWLTVTNEDGELRLNNENDFVHHEVATALADKEITVIPVLINDTRMPAESQLPPALKELASYQGVRISDDRIATDVQYLLKDMGKILTPEKQYTSTGNQTYGNTSFSEKPKDTARPAGHTADARQPGVVPAKPDNYLVWAILSTVLCCLITGIISIINASKVDNLYAQGQYAEALAASKNAKNWAMYGVIAGVIVWVLYLAFAASLGLSDFSSY